MGIKCKVDLGIG